MDNLGLKRVYQSMTMGNIVDTPWQVFCQMIESLVRLRTADFRWRVIWIS